FAAWVYSALLVLPVTGAVAHAGLQLVADRYSYLSGLGFAVLAGGVLAWFLRQRARFKPTVVGAALLAAVLVVAGWAYAARRQTAIWHDSETLWRHALDVHPENPHAHYYIAGALWSLGRAQEARAEVDIALSLAPDQLRYAKAAFHTRL